MTSTLGGGGAEQMVLQLAKQSNSSHKTIVVSLSNTLIALENRFRSNAIEYYLLGVNSFKNKSLLRGLKAFEEIISPYDNTVIHCHMYHAVIFGMLYKLKSPKTKLIFTLHSNTLEFPLRRIILFITKSLRYKDIIFSQKGKRWYLKRKSTIIPNGISFKEFENAFQTDAERAQKFTFLFIGRISHEKSPSRLLTAAKQLRAKNVDDFVIKFVGDGILKNQIAEQIEIDGLQDHVELCGFQDNIKPYLKEAHCLVLPSLWEGLPVVLIEAAATKTPIISTPVGSIPDFLNDTNAYLSSLENFHERMIEVKSNYDRATEKSEILYNELKSTFEITNVFKQHLAIYQLSLN